VPDVNVSDPLAVFSRIRSSTPPSVTVPDVVIDVGVEFEFPIVPDATHVSPVRFTSWINPDEDAAELFVKNTKPDVEVTTPAAELNVCPPEESYPEVA
jgi:hypothetical protein